MALTSVEFGDGELIVTDELQQIGVAEIEAGLNRPRKDFDSMGAMVPKFSSIARDLTEVCSQAIRGNSLG